MRSTYTRYHICLMRVKSRRVSLNRWFDVKYSSCRHVCLVFRIESYLAGFENVLWLDVLCLFPVL